MFLKSENIYLRAIDMQDLSLMYEVENNMAVWKVSNTLVPFSKHVIELYLQSSHQDIYTNKQLRLMICESATDRPVGTIDLFEFDPLHSRVGVGVLIFENYRKNGFAFDALCLIREYAKHTLMLHQLYCNISVSNTESISLFEKCGFKKAGLKKDWNRISQGEFEDELFYQLIL